MTRRSRTVAMAAATACVMGVLGAAPTAATAASATTRAAATNTASGSPAGVTDLTPEQLAAITQPKTREDLSRLMDLAEVPAGARVKLDSALARLSDAQIASMLAGGSRTEAHVNLRGHVLAAIDPTNYQCDTTPLDDYISLLLSEAGLPGLIGLSLMMNLGLLDIQTYEALLYAHTRPNTYGDDNEYAKSFAKSLRKAQDFWDVDTDDVILGAMDGELWQRMEGDSAEASAARVRAATAWATSRRTVKGPIDHDGTPIDVNLGMQMVAGFAEILKSPHNAFLLEGRSDLFTLNAFAFTTEDDPYAQSDPDLRTVSDRIIFGPGILRAAQALGFGDIGPHGILAHEFMHHVQYEHHVDFSAPNPADQPESTRRTELMADAGASYFASHKRGLTLNAKRMAEVTTTFYAVGDCSFDSAGHHGTPEQRRRASTWGSDLAAQEQRQGHILPSATVITRFEAALPSLVAPDAP